jgi:carbon monoxide dehydrogenase subunit G
MKIENTFRVDLPVSQAWRTLLDIPGIVTCMPGAELLGVEDDRTYRGQVKVKLGPVAVAFKGRAQLAEVDEAQHRVRAKASGTEEKGRGSAQADVTFRLSPDGTGTRVDVETNVTLAGAVAQYGRAQGVIADVAQVMVDQFARNLGQRIASSRGPAAQGPTDAATSTRAPAPASAPAISALSLVGMVLRRWLRRLMGKEVS